MPTARNSLLRLDTGPPSRRSEPIVPMINVVFLLLIFFLMTAEIAPPDPVDVTLPEAAVDRLAEPGRALFISKTGEIAFGSARGEAALALAVAQTPKDAVLNLRADALADAQVLARVLRTLSNLGVADVAILAREGTGK